jgi:hypothetical protein
VKFKHENNLSITNNPKTKDFLISAFKRVAVSIIYQEQDTKQVRVVNIDKAV